MLLCDWDCGESLNLLLVCRWGAGVLKLIEELKDKKEEGPEAGARFSMGWGRGWGVSTCPALQLQISKTRPIKFQGV